MQTLNITVGDKTYHVEVPSLNDGSLQVIVDGRPIEVCIGSAQNSATQLGLHAQPANRQSAVVGVLPATAYKPKMSEYTRIGD